jgi:dolichol-phosphate mannosyltransferase
VHNESGNIFRLCERLRATLQAFEYELIYVNDGSTDTTQTVLEDARKKYPEIRVISFSRNFGHQAAIKAGYDHAVGQCVITMDGDLEHPPESIPEMLAAWKSGYEIVIAKRRSSNAVSWHKRFFSNAFYNVSNMLSDVRMEPGGADFRLLDARVVAVCRNFTEQSPFWRGLIPWLGFRSTVIWYDQATRDSGESKYSLTKMIRFSLSGITGFSVRPLHFSLYLGLFFASFSFLYLFYVVGIKLFTDQSVSGWASMIACVLLIGGIQLVVLGVLGIYIGQLFIQSKARPTYILDESANYLRSEDSKPNVIKPLFHKQSV